MKLRVALLVCLVGVYAGAMRVTGQAPGLGAQGARSTARDWTQDQATKITDPFTLASVGDVIIIRPASCTRDSDATSTRPGRRASSIPRKGAWGSSECTAKRVARNPDSRPRTVSGLPVDAQASTH